GGGRADVLVAGLPGVGDSLLSGLAALGGDDDHPVRATLPVNGGSGGILQYLDGFNLTGGEIIRGIHQNPVDHEQGIVVVEGGDAPELAVHTTTWFPVRLNGYHWI